MYADDLSTGLYIPLQTYQAMQADIDALSDWILAHKLQPNCATVQKYACASE